MTRTQQRILANLGRDVNQAIQVARFVLAGLVIAVALIGAGCGHLVNLLSR